MAEPPAPVLDVRLGHEHAAAGPGEIVAIGADLLRAAAGPLLGWPATPLIARLRGSTPHGSVQLVGRRIDHLSTAARVRRGLAVVTTPAVAPDVSVRDHLAAVAPRGRAEETLADAPLLAGRGGEPAGILSGGERRILGWLRAYLQEPTAVVLERPTAGLDDRAVRWATGIVEGWQHGGVAIVVDPSRRAERSWLGSTPGLSGDGSAT
jgi:ABC-type uncharacterized transport system YnjBCD ATPase subunit